MNTHLRKSNSFLFAMSLLLLSCRLPGMLPLTPRPDMETNTDKVIEVLNGKDWVPLQALAAEQYTEKDFAKSGILTFTSTVTNEKPIYFSYSWCAKDEATLKQNLEHIQVVLYLDGDKLGSNVVHNLSFSRSDGMVCSDSGVLLSNWSPGKYELKAIATFDATINDGLDDYAAGDYGYVYNVSVEGDK